MGRFWDAAIADLGVVFSTPYTDVLDTSGGIERPAWCVGGRLNIVDSLLDRWRDTPQWTQSAVRYESEEGAIVDLTYAELADEVAACASGLRALGLGPGDAVGLFMPMTPELVVAFLAVAKIGGVILPLFSGYGPEAVATRLQDGRAKALVVADGLPRRGRAVPLKATADEALASCPTVEHVVVHARLGLDVADAERARPLVGGPDGTRPRDAGRLDGRPPRPRTW